MNKKTFTLSEVKKMFPRPFGERVRGYNTFTLAEGATHVVTSDNNCKIAFTLAEVLITLGIIGVVAVLTLPSVIQKQQEKITVNRLKSVYSILSQAFARTIEENGTPDTWGMGGMYDEQSHIIMGNAFVPYLKLSENCIGQSSVYIKNNCSKKFTTPNQYSSIVLSNGVAISFRTYYNNCNSGSGITKDTCGAIFIDINGMKRPNELGKDMFGFFITKTKIVPFGLKDTRPSFKQNCDITDSDRLPSQPQMSACAAWVLYNENMDYLHCTGLDWDGKHSCKD